MKSQSQIHIISRNREKSHNHPGRPVILLTAILAALCGCGGKAADTGEGASVHAEAAENGRSRILDRISGKDRKESRRAIDVSEHRYAYGTLEEEAQMVYDEIVSAILNREDRVRISTRDIHVMEQAYLAVRCDYSEIFWLDKFSYITYRRGDRITAIDVTPSYSMSEKEQAAVQKQIDREAERMLSSVPKNGADYEKALEVYERLITDVDYVTDSPDNQNIISVFLNHETICQGYAYATQYLLEKLGIPCATVMGTARGESHAWNLALLDGDYYYIDTTWGNSQYTYGAGHSGGTETGKYINYEYFAVTTDAILDTHQADERIRLPECTATEDNYYIREGRYFSSWDPQAVGELIRGDYEQGAGQTQIRFSDVELYEQALQYFVEDFHVGDYCPGLTSVRYLENPDNRMLFLVFPQRDGK